MPQTPEELRAKKRAYYLAHAPEIRAKRKAYVASHYEQVQREQKAYKETHREEKKAYDAARYLLLRDQILARKKARYARRRAEICAKRAAYVASHYEQCRAATAAYAKLHRIRLNAYKVARYAANIVIERTKKTAYRRKFPEKEKARVGRRRARKAGAPVNDLTAEQWQTILVAFRYRCAYCPPTCWRCKKKKHKLTQDHVTPYAHNGSNTLWNVVPACRSCNAKKHTGPPLKPVQPLLL
jgi:5-methylcytosine-specific restriction endonuclease McrA